jgi:histidinol-phosphate/aromatic aminotransferase/cobyric acid decarboxylase-like protein
MTRHSTVLSFGHVSPDLAVWLRAEGSRVITHPDLSKGNWASLLQAEQPALVHLERPDRCGRFATVSQIEELTAAAKGATVLVDEASANYLGPAASCVDLTNKFSNLMVLRGISKGYAAGGLRVGFGIAGTWLTGSLRAHLSPLQVSELSFHYATRLLAAGDIFHRLRARVREVKPELAERARLAGLTVDQGHPELPWLLVNDDGVARQTLWRALIAGRPLGGSLRLAVPLSKARVRMLRERLVGESNP